MIAGGARKEWGFDPSMHTGKGRENKLVTWS